MSADNLALLGVDLTTSLRNLAIGWQIKAQQIRDDADHQLQQWKWQTPDPPTPMGQGLLLHAQQEREWSYEVAAFFDRMAAQALGTSPALLVTGNPSYLRHPDVGMLPTQLGTIYAAAEAQGRIVVDRPPPPPARIEPVEQPEARDTRLAREAHEEAIRQAVAMARQYGPAAYEYSSELVRNPTAALAIQEAIGEYARRVTQPGT